MKEWVVKISDIEFIVRGRYIKGEPAHITSDPFYSDPGWGADIEDCEIYVSDSQIDIIEVLTQKTIDGIINNIIEQEDYSGR